jgi:hypothetical protein
MLREQGEGARFCPIGGEAAWQTAGKRSDARNLAIG